MNRRRALMSAASSGPAPVHGTWEDLFARIADGTYATAYSVGEILPLDLGTEGNVGAQIAAFNTDDKADDSGKAKVTFITKHVLNTAKRWNPVLSPSSAPYTEGTGTIGGWALSEIRAYIRNTVKPLIPSDIRNRIVEVTKKYYTYNTSGTASTQTIVDDVWLPSAGEVFGNYESGIRYSDLFGTTAAGSADAKRVKTKSNSSTAVDWWLRTGSSTSKSRLSVTNGSSTGYNSHYTGYFHAVGFCID